MDVSRLFVSLCCAWFWAACGASEKEVRPAGSDPFGGQMAAAGAGNQVEGGGEVADGVPGGSDAAPSLESGRYVFRLGEVELEVDPAVGGRVTRFSLAGSNILTGPDVVAGGDGSLPNMYGSTFWTSPQSDWGWPPEVAIDSAAHEVVLEGPVLKLVSEPGATTGYAVQKRFSTDTERGKVVLEYALINQAATLPAAPWEISRVPKEGLVFFAAASPALAQSSLASQLLDGVAWIDIAQAPAEDSKLFQDGSEGWLAYVYRDLVFIKVFDDIAPAEQATGEAEIEIFINGTFGYVEIEQQGPYSLPPVGGSSVWRVGWLLRRLPAEGRASVGNAALVSWVRDQVRRAR